MSAGNMISPDLDTIIVDRDYDEVNKLTESDRKNISLKQTMDISGIVTKCLLSGR